MSSIAQDQTERLVRYSRRQLWFVLVFLLLLGAGSVADALFAPRVSLLASIPVFIVLFLAFPLKTDGIDFSPSNPAVKALRNDELRQFAQNKAFRNGFLVMLAFPPACAFLLTGLGVANPLPAVVGGSAWVGAVVFLATLLWYDR